VGRLYRGEGVAGRLVPHLDDLGVGGDDVAAPVELDILDWVLVLVVLALKRAVLAQVKQQDLPRGGPHRECESVVVIPQGRHLWDLLNTAIGSKCSASQIHSKYSSKVDTLKRS